jgi:magnesium-transporting ATPase (P-type)
VQNRNDEGELNTALVVRTGFMCEKGEMIKSILYPTPERFNFQWESLCYLLSNAVVCIVGVGAVIYVLIENFSAFDIVISYLSGKHFILDIFTISSVHVSFW